jgi:endonuclease YncB( thermonuclease family)
MSNGDLIHVKNKVVGLINGDTFHKRVKASKHFLKRPPAICFDVSTIEDAEAKGAEHVCVTDRETWKVYHARIDTVKDKGFTMNRGFGEQIALPLNRWSPTRVNLMQRSLL